LLIDDSILRVAPVGESANAQTACVKSAVLAATRISAARR
jgi:hypothetical protein